MEVNKYQTQVNKSLRCEFGFHNSVGVVPIEDRTAFGKIYSSATQYVDTVLPRDLANPDMMTVYCKCYDSSGKQRMKVYPVTLEKASGTEQLSLDTTSPRLSDILIYSWNYVQTG